MSKNLGSSFISYTIFYVPTNHREKFLVSDTKEIEPVVQRVDITKHCTGHRFIHWIALLRSVRKFNARKNKISNPQHLCPFRFYLKGTPFWRFHHFTWPLETISWFPDWHLQSKQVNSEFKWVFVQSRDIILLGNLKTIRSNFMNKFWKIFLKVKVATCTDNNIHLTWGVVWHEIFYSWNKLKWKAITVSKSNHFFS